MEGTASDNGAPVDRPPSTARSAADPFQDVRGFAEPLLDFAEPLLDFGLIAVAYYAAYRLRFEGAVFDGNFGFFLQPLPVVVACRLAALGIAGTYRAARGRFGLIDT